MKIIITEEEAYSMGEELMEIKAGACKLLKRLKKISELDFRSHKRREDDDDDDDDDDMHFRRGRGRY